VTALSSRKAYPIVLAPQIEEKKHLCEWGKEREEEARNVLYFSRIRKKVPGMALGKKASGSFGF